MNPETEQEWREDEPVEAELMVDGSDPSDQPSTPKPPAKSRRPRGKIARMRKEDRDRLNFLLRDGVGYAEVISKLGEAGKGLIPRNVSSWHTGVGYQRWQMDQEWLEDMRADQEPGLDLLPDFDSSKFNEAALQVAVTQLFRAFRHIGSGELKQKLGGDPQGFARLVNALARACRETVNLQKHREAAAKAVAAELKRLDPTRKISDHEHGLVMDKVEEMFHIKLPRPADAASGPPPGNPKAT